MDSWSVFDIFARWALTAVALRIAASWVKGVEITGWTSALAGAFVFALVQMSLGVVLFWLTLPLTILTFGLFMLVINSLCFRLAAAVVPGFRVRGWMSALIGSIVVSSIQLSVRWVFGAP